MALGSFCSPPEYHIRNSLALSSNRTCGHMTATFSHGSSADSTGLSPARSHVLPSLLVALPIHERPRAWPVYHILYDSPCLRTTGRFTSLSQSVFWLVPRTMTGLLHLTPSLLSTNAMLFLGRQENHMR